MEVISLELGKSINQFGIRSKAMTIWTIPFLSNKRSAFVAIVFTMFESCSFLIEVTYFHA